MNSPKSSWKLEDIKSLSDMTSSSYRVSNRAWLGLMAVATIVLIPRNGPTVELPFGLGTVERASFDAVALIALVAVALSFAAAHAQAVRSHRMTLNLFEGMSSDEKETTTGIHPRDLLDALQQPTLNRVAPLSQVLKGRHQFFPEVVRVPPSLRRLATVYYVILKAVAFGYYFGLPVLALFFAGRAAQSVGWLRWLANGGAVVAFVALGQVAILEAIHVYKLASSGLHTTERDGGAT